MKKKTAYILISIITAMIVAGIGILIYIHKAGRDSLEIKVRENGETEERLEMFALNMKPGEAEEYELILISESEGEYEVSLSFEERESGELKKYVRVEIESGEEKIEKSLEELLRGEEAKIGVRFEEEKRRQVVIRYKMPEEVGNEAQGTEAKFDIVVRAERSE